MTASCLRGSPRRSHAQGGRMGIGSPPGLGIGGGRSFGGRALAVEHAGEHSRRAPGRPSHRFHDGGRLAARQIEAGVGPGFVGPARRPGRWNASSRRNACRLGKRRRTCAAAPLRAVTQGVRRPGSSNPASAGVTWRYGVSRHVADSDGLRAAAPQPHGRISPYAGASAAFAGSRNNRSVCAASARSSTCRAKPACTTM